MAYNPDPTDYTRPVDGDGAESATAEFRALKQYIQGLLPTGLNAGILSFRNRLINAYAEIDQVNEGVVVNIASNAGKYIVDGCIVSFVNATAALSAQRVTDAPAGFKNSVKVTVSTAAGAPAASDYAYIQFPIEGNLVADFQWGTANAKIASFGIYVKFSVAGTYGLNLINNSANRSYINTFTILAAQVNTWVFIPINNIPGDTTGTWATDNTASIWCRIVLLAGINFQGVAGWQAGNFNTTNAQTQALETLNATFQFAGWQLEQGANCTLTERAPFGVELFRCMRLFEKSYDIGTVIGTVTITGRDRRPAWNAGDFYMSVITFRVDKRDNPTMQIYSPGTGAAGKFAIADNGADVGALGNAIASTARAYIYNSAGTFSANQMYHFHWTADSRL